MGDTDHEHSPLSVLKMPISVGNGAKSDTRYSAEVPKDSNLYIIVKALPELPEYIEAAIKALIQILNNKPLENEIY